MAKIAKLRPRSSKTDKQGFTVEVSVRIPHMSNCGTDVGLKMNFLASGVVLVMGVCRDGMAYATDRKSDFQISISERGESRANS